MDAADEQARMPPKDRLTALPTTDRPLLTKEYLLFLSVHNVYLLKLAQWKDNINDLEGICCLLKSLAALYGTFHHNIHASLMAEFDEAIGLVSGIVLDSCFAFQHQDSQSQKVFQALFDVLYALFNLPGIFLFPLRHQQTPWIKTFVLAFLLSATYSSDKNMIHCEAALDILETFCALDDTRIINYIKMAKNTMKIVKQSVSQQQNVMLNLRQRERAILQACIFCFCSEPNVQTFHDVTDETGCWTGQYFKDAFDQLTASLLKAAWGRNTSTASQILQLIQACLVRMDDTQSVLLCQSLDCFMDISTHSNNPMMAEKAAHVVNHILQSSLFTEAHTALETTFDTSVVIAKRWLSSPFVTVIEVGLRLLHHILSHSQQESSAYFQMLNAASNDYILDLASIAISKKDQLSTEGKKNLLQCFLQLINDLHDVNSLARESVSVRFLVQVIGGVFDDVGNLGHRDMAASIVFEMSLNPCNRRGLAATPGLVPSMICFVRSQPEGISSSLVATISKHSMKEQIYALAAAL
jgi:hypothetical protein